jgi:hypothetical protein
VSRTIRIVKKPNSTIKYETKIDSFGDGSTQVYDFTGTSFRDKLGVNNELVVEECGVLPPGLRILKRKPHPVLVFEKTPRIVNVKYYFMKKTEGAIPQFTSIPVPWTVYIVYFNDFGQIQKIYHYWRNKPLKGYDSALYHPMITNIYNNTAEVCLPDFTKGAPPQTSLEDIMDLSYRSVWEAIFNFDIPIAGNPYDMIRAAERRYNKVTPEKFMGINMDFHQNMFKMFPTYGRKLFDVLNQQYSCSHPRQTGLSIPKNCKDLDGETTYCAYLTLRSALQTTTPPLVGQRASLEQIHSTLIEDIEF